MKTYEYAGRSRTLSEWAKLLKVSRNTLETRIRRGYPLSKVFGPVERIEKAERATSGKKGRKPQLYEYHGKSQTIAEWADDWGCSKSAAKSRFHRIKNGVKTRQESLCWNCIHRMLNYKRGYGCSWAYNLEVMDGMEYEVKKAYRETVKVITKCSKFKRGRPEPC